MVWSADSVVSFVRLHPDLGDGLRLEVVGHHAEAGLFGVPGGPALGRRPERARHPGRNGKRRLGVTVAYFEWLQDINRRAWLLGRVDQELDDEKDKAWTAARTPTNGRRRPPDGTPPPSSPSSGSRRPTRPAAYGPERGTVARTLPAAVGRATPAFGAAVKAGRCIRVHTVRSSIYRPPTMF